MSRLGGGDLNAFLLKVIQLRPQVLSRKSEKITNLLGGLEAYGFSKTDLAQMVLKNPSLLGYDQKSVEEKPAVLEGSGFTRDQVRSFFSLSPKVFDLSLEANFKPTLRFFLDTGWTAEDSCRFPQILNYSLGKRIRPRLKVHHGEGSELRDAGTARWIVLSDADFAKKVAKCGEEEWEDYVMGRGGANGLAVTLCINKRLRHVSQTHMDQAPKFNSLGISNKTKKNRPDSQRTEAVFSEGWSNRAPRSHLRRDGRRWVEPGQVHGRQEEAEEEQHRKPEEDHQ